MGESPLQNGLWSTGNELQLYELHVIIITTTITRNHMSID